MPRKSAAKKAQIRAREQPFDHNKNVEDAGLDEDLSQSSSSDEEEDDMGGLLTENVEANIQKVLETIRSNPDKLLDKNTKFFDEQDFASAQTKKQDKPVYLKDYHRDQLLKKMKGSNTEEEPLREVYRDQQEAERKRLVAEIHGEGDSENKNDNDNDNKEADSDDDDDDANGFLTKRKDSREIEPITAAELPDPNENEAEFLNAFVNSRAWVPTETDGNHSFKKRGRKSGNDEDGSSAGSDSEQDIELADQFENAYNHRFEEPGASEIVSYARSQSTLRRKEQSSRKRQREKKNELEKSKKTDHDKKMAKVKNQKVNEVMQKFEQQLMAGMDDDVAQLLSQQDLDGDFDADEWDKRMAAVFDKEFYENFEAPEKGAETENADEEPQLSNNKKRKLEKEQLKNEKKRLKELAESFVKKNMDLVVDEVMEDTPGEMRFKYREVSPESYGLTARDILLADDKQLNSYVSMKKLASFRDDAHKASDRKKFNKAKRLREWRKEVFQSETGPGEDEIAQSLNGPAPAASSTPAASSNKVAQEPSKESKHKHKHKSKKQKR